jgi:hypothetical protein
MGTDEVLAELCTIDETLNQILKVLERIQSTQQNIERNTRVLKLAKRILTPAQEQDAQS